MHAMLPILPLIDGLYIICDRSFVPSDDDPVPTMSDDGLAVYAASSGLVFVSGWDLHDERVEVSVERFGGRPDEEWLHACEAHWHGFAYTKVASTSGLEVRTLEHSPMGTIVEESGTFNLGVFGRTVEQQLLVGQEAPQEHMLVVWPAG